MRNVAGGENEELANEEQIGRNNNNHAEKEGEDSDDDDDEPYIVDEDTECSPCIPLIQFHGIDNPTGFTRCENVCGELRLKPRINTLSIGSIVHYTIPNSPETSTSIWYGTCSRYNFYQACKKMLETQIYGCPLYTTRKNRIVGNPPPRM